MLLTIPVLTGLGGVTILEEEIDATDDLVTRKILVPQTGNDFESYSMLSAGIQIVNDGLQPNPAGTLGLTMVLLRKDKTGLVFAGEPLVLDVPVRSMPTGGVIYQRSVNTFIDGVFVDVTKAPLGDYQWTITPDGGPPVTIAFTRTNSGAAAQTLIVVPVPILPPVTIPPAPVTATLRAKLVWVAP